MDGPIETAADVTRLHTIDFTQQRPASLPEAIALMRDILYVNRMLFRFFRPVEYNDKETLRDLLQTYDYNVERGWTPIRFLSPEERMNVHNYIHQPATLTLTAYEAAKMTTLSVEDLLYIYGQNNQAHFSMLNTEGRLTNLGPITKIRNGRGQPGGNRGVSFYFGNPHIPSFEFHKGDPIPTGLVETPVEPAIPRDEPAIPAEEPAIPPVEPAISEVHDRPTKRSRVEGGKRRCSRRKKTYRKRRRKTKSRD